MQYIVQSIKDNSETKKPSEAVVTFKPSKLGKLFGFKDVTLTFFNQKGDWVTANGKVAFGKLKIKLADELSSVKYMQKLKELPVVPVEA